MSNILKYCLGVDVSKEDFHCCISSIDSLQKVQVKASHKFSNNKSGFADLEIWIGKHGKQKEVPFVIVMEATGVYYERLAIFLSRKQHHVSVVLPNKAKKYLQSRGAKSKNDKIDAKGLSQMGAEQCLDEWTPLSSYFYSLRLMTRQHQSLQELKTSIKNQLEALELGMYLNKTVIKQHKATLSLIEKQLKVIAVEIENHINKNTEIKSKVEKICKIKGVSTHTVAVVLAETNGFALFKNSRQLVSYAGYDIVENQSGKHKGRTRISKKGNSRIRRALFMPAFSVVTHNQTPFIGLYKRIFEKHGEKMKSYVAVQKKLLVIIFSLWKNEEAYQLNYQQLKHTGEKEQMPSSLLGLEQADTENKNSTIKNDDATQGRHTVEISQPASSLLLQN